MLVIKYQEFEVLLHIQHHLYLLFRPILGLFGTNYILGEVRTEVKENLTILLVTKNSSMIMCTSVISYGETL